MKKHLILLLLASAILAACKNKKPGYTGYVSNNLNNKPLKGVLVTHEHYSTLTNDSGYFWLPPNGSGPIVFKLKGFYTDSYPTNVNHSGEYMEEMFNDDKIGLYPVQKNFSTLEEYRLSLQPKPLNTGVVYSSEQVKPFYKHDIKTQDYTLIRPDGYGFEKYYQPIIPVKGSHFNYDIKLGTDFMNVKSLSINHIPCKLIAYSLPGENDTQIINFQLNSYDNNHQLRDALLLDNRFTFEVIYYNDFKIHGDGKIDITRFSINRFEQNKEGDLIGEKAKPDTTIIKETYQLNEKGDFVEIK